jgi:hypothetical protein
VEDDTSRERVKVVDRRWVTAEGELREGLAIPAAAEPEPPERVDEPAAAAAPEEVPEPPAQPVEQPPKANLPSRVLLDVVDILAQYAMAFLTGQVPGLARDPQTARLFIDMLNLLKERTGGQTSLQESKVLDDVLTQLRIQLMAAPR